jgi:NADH-quinone oxidoreductase subunit H
LLQPLADGLKLLAKEIIIPRRARINLFLGAPLYTFLISLMGWCAIPWSPTLVFADPRLSALYVFAISSLGVYGILLAG